MRMDTIKFLNEDELSLLLYIVNEINPMTCPKMKIGINELPWLRMDMLLHKLKSQESKLTDEGKIVLENLIKKLTKFPHIEAEEFRKSQHENTKNNKSH